MASLRDTTLRKIQRWPALLALSRMSRPSGALSRLLRLSLFQVPFGMALVLLVGTLNRG